MTKSARYQVNYLRRETETNAAIKGSVIFKARHASQAVDYTIAELDADDETASFVILAVKEMAVA